MHRIYYAHCIHLYGSPQEARDVLTLEALGFRVTNPNSDDVNHECARVRTEVQERNEEAALAAVPRIDAGAEVMRRIFEPLVKRHKFVAFRALPDGRIPAGVLKEIEWAREAGATVIELPGNLLGRSMSVDETREYLREVGQR